MGIRNRVSLGDFSLCRGFCQKPGFSRCAIASRWPQETGFLSRQLTSRGLWKKPGFSRCAIVSRWPQETGFLGANAHYVEVFGRNPVSQDARSRLLWRSETGFLSEISHYVEVFGRNPVSQDARSCLLWRSETGFLAEISHYVEIWCRNPVSSTGARSRLCLASRNRVSHRDLSLCRG